MAEEDSNIQENVSNKTESHSATEFSLRSVISYMMLVLTTHFVNAEPTKYHNKIKELENNPLFQLLCELNKSVWVSKYLEDELKKIIYILLNLITSTDECSLFVISQLILSKITWYFSLRPSIHNQPGIDSNRWDNYTTTFAGDTHLGGGALYNTE